MCVEKYSNMNVVRSTFNGWDNNKLNSKRYSKTNGNRYDGIYLFEFSSDWQWYATVDMTTRKMLSSLSAIYLPVLICIDLQDLFDCSMGKVNNIIKGSVDDVDERFRTVQ